MTRRGATVRRQWPRLRMPWPVLDVRVFQRLAVVVSVAALLAGAIMGVRWLTPDAVRWDVRGELLFQDEGEIQTVLERFNALTYWELSLEEIEERLEELPWLDQARLERHWPNQVQVHLTEQTPLAFWNNDAFINSRGEVFGPSEVAFELPRLAGPDGQSQEVMANYLRFSQMFGTMGYRIEALTLASRGAWVLTLDNGIEVKLGQHNILQRARRVARVLALANEDQRAGNIATLDARHQHGVAVAWKSGEAA